MGKYKILRSFLSRKKSRQADLVLKDCPLVIEGKSFFKQLYEDNNYNFILGGEYDRYAEFLKIKLMQFMESNITCYVVFTGAMEVDIAKREVIHQKIISDRENIEPNDKKNEKKNEKKKKKFFDPIFVKNVHRQVLDELGIRYCVSEYNARPILLDLATELGCPVLTYHFEQCLLGMTCVDPETLWYDKQNRSMSCKIRTPESFKEQIIINYDMIPILFTVLDENLPLFYKISEILGSNPREPVGPLLYWIRKHEKAGSSHTDLLDKLLHSEVEKKMVRESIDEISNMIFHKEESSALKYLRGEQATIDENDSFRNGVMTGKIPSVYINLKNKGSFSGSWVLFDSNKPDAMLPVLDIIFYAHSLVWDTPQNLTFIGREGSLVYVTNMPPRHSESSMEFEKFVSDTLPGFDWALLKSLPEESWLVIISLVYYICKAGKNFTRAAYSILLSYVMLGPVSEKVGLIKMGRINNRGDQEDGISTDKDFLEAAKSMVGYFDEGDVKTTFDRSLLHDLVEFQHCLQHMNYLNKLCGEKIKCTNYYKMYNGTFIFNVILELRKYEDPMTFFNSHLKNSPSILLHFKHIKDAFDCLVSATNPK